MKYEKNNIYNVDCYQAIKEIPDNSVDLVYTDIPYDISYEGAGCLSKNVSNNKKSMNKHRDTLLQGIDYSILDEFVRICKKPYIYIWCSKNQILDIMNYFAKYKNMNSDILVWAKDNPVPFGNRQFLSDLEYCLVFYEKGAKVHLGIEHKHKWYLSHLNTKDKKKYGHPTIKPLELVKNHIINSTNEGDCVLDCFMGSGTTCVACKETNRNYIGFELIPEYYDIAKKRLEEEKNDIFKYLEEE